MSRQDGDLDIFWGASDDADLSTGVNKVDRNDGGGAFVAISDGVVTAELVTSSNPVNVNAFCDFDGDGDIDIAQWQETSAGRMFRNDGKLTFTSMTNEFTASAAVKGKSMTCADYDGDGDLDLVVGTDSSSVGNKMFRNDGALTFTAVTNGFTAASQHPTTFLAWGDYDNVRTRRPCLL